MNKKKIFIGVIVVLVVICLVCLLVVFLNKKETTSVDNPKSEVTEETPKAENEDTEDLDNKETENDAETEDETTNTDENISVKEETTSQQAVSTPTPKPTGAGQTTIKQENKVTPTPVTQKQENAESKQPTTTPAQSTEEKTENNTPTSQPEKPKETFAPNYEMIERIRQTIKANETEDMKTYGYEIVVDSSIKGKTNPFTFTELRVKNMIKYSFGTIRIYAENYYVGGELVMVNCYIL